jgi:hypothetical protein
MENYQDVTQDSSPEDEVTQDSSPETTEQSEATEEQAVQEEAQPATPGPIPYDRFQEVVQQRNQTAQDVEHWRNIATQLTEKYQQPNVSQPTQVEQDIIQKYGAQDPATREFLRDIDARIDQRANKVADQRAAPLARENEALKRTVATMQEKMFRVDNTDVERDSQEEREIAQMISMGVPLEKATWAVMGPKRVESAKINQQVKQTVKTKTKVQANLENRSIPQVSGLPQKRAENFREKADRIFREGGLS